MPGRRAFPSASLIGRLTFFENAVDSFQVVLGRVADGLNCGAIIQKIMQMRRLRLTEQCLQHTRGYGRTLGNAFCQFQRAGHQCVGFDAFECKADLGGLGPLDNPAREGQLGRALNPDPPGQNPGTTVSGNDADIDKGLAELCSG